jgi:protein ImuB
MGMNPQVSLWEDPGVGAVGAAVSGPRYLVVRLPAFRLERCGFGAEEVVALIAERQNATRLVACTPAAIEAGLREGMTAAEARALVTEVQLEPLDEPGEAVDLADLVRCLDVLCDRVRAFGEDEILLEISACAGVFGGEQATLAKVRAYVEDLGHHCVLALADHPLAAAALARVHPSDVLVLQGEGAQALARLPLWALGPSEELRAGLRALGIRHVGRFASLDAASVAGRFGEEGLDLHRVAQGVPAPVWGALPQPSAVGRMQLVVEHELVSVDEIMLRVARGLDDLRTALESRGEVVTILELRLDVDRGMPVRMPIRVGRPTRDPAVLAPLVRTRLDRLTLEAPVVGLTLHAPEVCPERGEQEDLLARREAIEPLSELLVRLTEALGEEAVSCPELTETWRPEAAWVARPVHAPEERPPTPVEDDPVAWQEEASWALPRPRPTLLRRLPRPVKVRTRSDVPCGLRTLRGWVPILQAEGPEVLEGDWWHADGGFARRYWVARLPERTVWLFEERGAWYLHGWF